MVFTVWIVAHYWGRARQLEDFDSGEDEQAAADGHEPPAHLRGREVTAAMPDVSS